MLFAMNFLGEWRIRRACLLRILWLRPEQLSTWFSYLDEKEYPQAAKASPKDFYDNSFVESLEKAGFFKTLGAAK